MKVRLQSVWCYDSALIRKIVALATSDAGINPSAPCPLCSNERNDKRPKALYAINGFIEGEYDNDIPKVWFDVPPVKLDSSGLGMEALRVYKLQPKSYFNWQWQFQYLSLIRYGTIIERKAHENQIRNEALMKQYSVLQSSCESMRHDNNCLKRRITELGVCEKELLRWRAKEKMIVRHLKAVKNVVK